MGYRLEWRLLGREGRFLDSGEIDDDFPDRGSALLALGALLLHFPVWGRKVCTRSVPPCWAWVGVRSIQVCWRDLYRAYVWT
jgi:hypothetical protein